MKKIIVLILIITILFTCLSCSVDNGVTPFGNARFKDNSFIQDVTWLILDGNEYIYAGSFEDLASVGEKNCVAGFNGADNYSYKVYTLNDYTGILLVNFISKVNLVNTMAVYASKEIDSVPAGLIYDFPHKDTWLYGGQNFTINGKLYCEYRQYANNCNIGKLLFNENGIDYYEIKDEPLWITKKIVDKSGTYYTLYYEVDSVTSLPVSILLSTADS